MARFKACLERGAEKFSAKGPLFGWILPILLIVTIASVVWVLVRILGLPTSGTGDGLSARLTWATAAMLFTVFFVFSIVFFNTVMFACGSRADAMFASALTTVLGLLSIAYFLGNSDVYAGPKEMHALLNATAYCLESVRTLTAVFDGFAFWAALLVVATACVIARHEVTKEEALSLQLRYASMMMYAAAALLIAGVSETSALHKWPTHDIRVGTTCPSSLPAPWNALVKKDDYKDYQKEVTTTATAISTSVGTVFSLILAATYLPLAMLLRQRAHRVVKPHSRTEAWLAVHGFSIQPTQQLSRVLVVLSPLLAGGPVSYLISLLSK
jgi:hypothetical protein